MRIAFSLVDAFADAPFSGNPAAVMPLGAWLPEAQMQAIAAQTNQPVTSLFTVCETPALADFDIRWFMPGLELQLCGHGTLAAGHMVLAAVPAMNVVRFQTRQAGVLSVARGADGQLAMALPARPATVAAPPSLHKAAGAALGAMPAELWMRDEDYLLAVFEHAHEIRALRPDHAALRQLVGRDTAVAATALALGDPCGATIISRVFVVGMEDSVTGSAHTVAVPYWAARMGRSEFSAYQASARGGHLGCSILGETVTLSGRCRTVVEGEFILA